MYSAGSLERDGYVLVSTRLAIYPDVKADEVMNQESLRVDGHACSCRVMFRVGKMELFFLRSHVRACGFEGI